MRKLRLDLEAVQVESFATQVPVPGKGTVDGRQQGRETFGCPAPTADITCGATCGCGGGTGYSCASCAVTCDATCWDPTCESCMATCNYNTGPERCCA